MADNCTSVAFIAGYTILKLGESKETHCIVFFRRQPMKKIISKKWEENEYVFNFFPL